MSNFLPLLYSAYIYYIVYINIYIYYMETSPAVQLVSSLLSNIQSDPCVSKVWRTMDAIGLGLRCRLNMEIAILQLFFMC